MNLKGRKKLTQWLREVEWRNLPFLLKALRRTQHMMDPAHYLREYDLAPIGRSVAFGWGRESEPRT